jgi:hypothetical protein
MRALSRLLILVTLVLGSASVSAAELNCTAGGNIEEFRYSWRVRGALRWVAGLVFPTSGVGNLKTVFPAAGATSINSELLITPENGRSGGFFEYESEMDLAGQRTLVTSSGYEWGEKARNERTIFDYVKRLLRIRKQTPEKIEEKVKPLPDMQLRDVLTAIYFLRQNAPNIKGPITTHIYSEGKEYPVVFRPAESATFNIEGRRVRALGFEIVDAPGGKKWPGGVKVWLSEDSRRIPFRIQIMQSFATLQLDLESVEACGFMRASR